ncbi:MAG: acyl-CoA dehydrogenase family protein [Nitriliruptorales bacterium]|nr:acyl-CoA dehydrogenase family protein [Nitriliruptorales bacterium]
MTLSITPFQEEHEALRDAAARWAASAADDDGGAAELGLGGDDPWANVVVLQEAFRASRPLGRSVAADSSLPTSLAEAVGVCEAARVEVGRAIAYARQREAFGRPIAGFQVIKHMLVEMATAVEACAHLVLRTVDRWQAGLATDAEVAAAARAAATMDLEVTDRAMQVHGGAGYSEEFPVGDAWLDARTFASEHVDAEDILSDLEVSR